MSDRSVLEEAFTRLLVSESIFDDSPIPTSPNKFKNMKDLRAVSDHCVFLRNSDDDCAFEDDANNNNIERSLSDPVVTGTKRQVKSGNSSPEHKRRKSVTFADSQGGDLVQVREFDYNVDPIQNCLSDPVRSNSDAGSPKYLLLFPQPCANYTAFMRRLFTQKVCLENAQIISEAVLIGTVKVQNLSFEKRVDIRLTMDSWKSFSDIEAKFLHSENGDIDVFTFRVQIPSDVTCARFCIRFSCNGSEYWDNNDGANYCVVARQHPDNNNSFSRNKR